MVGRRRVLGWHDNRRVRSASTATSAAIASTRTKTRSAPIADLQTIGIRLNREQAIHLARVLLAVTQEWDEIDITGYRFRRRQDDGTYLLTVTSMVEAESEAPDAEPAAAPDRGGTSA